MNSPAAKAASTSAREFRRTDTGFQSAFPDMVPDCFENGGDVCVTELLDDGHGILGIGEARGEVREPCVHDNLRAFTRKRGGTRAIG